MFIRNIFLYIGEFWIFYRGEFSRKPFYVPAILASRCVTKGFLFGVISFILYGYILDVLTIYILDVLTIVRVEKSNMKLKYGVEYFNYCSSK